MAKKETVFQQLTALAFQETKPFCYLCYKEVKTSHCPKAEQMDRAKKVDSF